jgi:hypothetical protein
MSERIVGCLTRAGINVVFAPLTFMALNYITGDRPLLTQYEIGACVGVVVYILTNGIISGGRTP